MTENEPVRRITPEPGNPYPVKVRRTAGGMMVEYQMPYQPAWPEPTYEGHVGYRRR